MFPTKCPIMNTLPVNELGSVPQQTCLFFVQCFCRLNAHDLTGRYTNPDDDHDNYRHKRHSLHNQETGDGNNRHRIGRKSIKARFRLMTAAGTVASIIIKPLHRSANF